MKPAVLRKSGTPFNEMRRGEYQVRFDKRSIERLWFFCMPASGRIVELEDWQVKTVAGLPYVRIRSWELDRTEWRFVGESSK